MCTKHTRGTISLRTHTCTENTCDAISLRTPPMCREDTRGTISLRTHTCTDTITERLLLVKRFPPGRFLGRGKKLVQRARAAPLNQSDGSGTRYVNYELDNGK